jgi:phage gp29-like protein
VKVISPFTGNVFERPIANRQAPALAAARKTSPLPLALSRIVKPEAQMRWLLPQLATITPAYIETVLRGAIAGSHVHQWELFDLMEDTWPRLAKNLNELKRAVLKLNWKLEAWAEEDEPPTPSAEERAKLVSNACWQMRPASDMDENAFEGTLYDLLDAWAKGLTVLEVEWEQRAAGKLGEILAPRASFWVHPQNYAWGANGRLGLVLPEPGSGTSFLGQRFTTQVEPFPEDKFLVSLCKARSGNPLAGALLRPLAWWWCAANFSASWFLNFAQIFGVPIRWANYDPNTPGLLDTVCDMLENMGSAAWAAFPPGTTLEIKEPAKAGTDNPQIALLDRADKNCDLLILGQTLTTDVGQSGSLALGDVHQNVRADFIQAAADFVAGVINQQLVPAILRLNYGDEAEAPYFLPQPQKIEDTKANAERDNILLQQGVELPKKWFYERHGIPLPQEGEETITGRPQVVPGVPGDPSMPGPNREDAERAGEDRDARASLRAKNATDKVVDAALEDLTGVEARWLGAVKPIFGELVMLAQSETVTDAQFIRALERAQKELPDLFARMDHRALENALYDAMSAGLVNGATKGFMDRRTDRTARTGRSA